MDIGDAIKFAFEKGQAEARPLVLSIPGGAPDEYILSARDQNGVYSTQVRVANPRPRDYRALSVDGFVGIVNHLAPKFAADRGGVVVVVGDASVVAILGEHERRERVVLELQHTEAFKSLGELRDVSQQDLVWTLRTDLKGSCLDPKFLAAVRSLKFSSNSQGMSERTAGTASIGRSVMLEIKAGDAPIPETVAFELSVFKQHGYPRLIECAVNVNLDEQLFTLESNEDEVLMVVHDTLKNIAAAVREATKQNPNVVVVESVRP